MHDQTGDNPPPSPAPDSEPRSEYGGSSAGPDALSRYLQAARASSTRRAYQSDIAHFLTPGSVPTILKRRMAVMGYDSTEFAGHSLRAGFVTAAAYSGMPIWRIVRQTGHRSIDIASRYIRPVHPL